MSWIFTPEESDYENKCLVDSEEYLHIYLNRSKNHYIVLPEQLAKVYQHTPFFFFVMDSLGKHRYKKLFQLLEYLAEHVHTYLPHVDFVFWKAK